MRHHMRMALVMTMAALAWPTTTLAAIYNVRLAPYNATGNGTTDDTLAVQNAITAAYGSGGGEVYFPAGTYKLSNSLTAYWSVRLRGDGQRTSVLRYDGLPDNYVGLYFVSQSSTPNNVLDIKGLSFVRATGTGGSAIYAEWPNGAPPPNYTVTYEHGGGLTTVIEDVHVGSDPWPSQTTYWGTGIQLRNATHAKIATFNIQGAGAEYGTAGIDIHGSPDSGPQYGRSVGVTVHDGTITGFQNGVLTSGNYSEGLHAQSLLIRKVRYGLQLVYTGPGTSITTCDISAQWRGVMAFNTLGDIAITNNIIYRESDQFFAGIQIWNGAGVAKRYRVIGNIIQSPAGTTQQRYGISAGYNVEDSIIMGNIAYNMTLGIYLENAPVTNTTVIGNINPFASTSFVNGGTNTHTTAYTSVW